MAKFLTTTGYGLETVQVSYDIDDGIVFDVEIKWNGIEVSGLLSEDVINDIEMECHANERKLAMIEKVNAVYDRGEQQANELLEAA